MYGYIYITTNLINNKKYIGKHKSSKFTEDYKGSGKYLWNAINKYGWDNFKVEMIEECNSNEELNDKERYWISYYNAVKSSEFYNITEGGDGRSMFGKDNGMYGKHHSIESRNKISNSIKGENNPFYGRHHSDKTKEILRIKSSKYLMGNKYNLGRKLSEETKKKMSESHKKSGNKPPNCEGKKFINNGITNKLVYINELNSYLLNGWILGRLSYSNRKYFINNGIINKRVSQDEIEEYLNNGWFRGRLGNGRS